MLKMHFGISVKFTNRKQDNMRNFFVVVSLIKDSILNIYIFGPILLSESINKQHLTTFIQK